MLLQFQIYIEVSHLSEKVMEEEVMKSQLCHELSFVDYLWETNFAKDMTFLCLENGIQKSIFFPIYKDLWYFPESFMVFSLRRPLILAELWRINACAEVFHFFLVVCFYFLFFFSPFIYTFSLYSQEIKGLWWKNAKQME